MMREADDQSAALGYFITPCVGTLVTLMSYLLLPKLVRVYSLLNQYTSEFARFFLDKGTMQRCELDTASQLLPKEGSQGGGGDLNGPISCSVANGNPCREDGGVSRQAFVSLEVAVTKETKSSVLEVLKKVNLNLYWFGFITGVYKIWVMAFCVTFVFTVTLSVFPAITVDVKTVYQGKWEHYFTPVCCFLLFNLMDWFGRTVTTLLQWPRKESCWFPVLVVLRVVFIPLLMLCNVQERHFLPVIFNHDAIFIFIMVLFSASSGYFVCLSMSYAPQLVAPHDGETAGALMTFFLALGLSLGAALSFLLRVIV
ncbi:hypothetical protein P4O66_012762 [Electrophorus voltai]|uniref:Solute carrier family 29 member 2 n=1 Tax=Electrophorus voltai TaxID=2609070 RepID=A0AAD8Z4T8_9TELE|nr:hypothetical protein P4O66_012762 [Electrophorus voltai]